MAQDFADLATTEGYAALLTRIGDRDVALALGFDPATTSPSNIKTNTLRWNSANGYWEKYNGSTWAAMASTYNITVSKATHLVGGVAGALAYQSGADATAFSAAGTAGQVALSGGTGAPTWSDLGLITYGYTSKATPVDADSLPLSDSAATNGPKKLTLANLKAMLFTGWGALIAAGTSKTTPVDGDSLAISDSAASGATKKLTWANLKATLKTATDALYMALVAPGASGQVLTSNGSAWVSSAVPSGLPRSYLAGYGLSNNGTDAVNDIDIAVGTCRDTTNAYDIALASALTKRLDAAWAVGTNQGGLDTGTVANGTYHLWAIKRSDTGVVDVLFSASATAPTMPANYDAKRRIGSILRESGSIVAFKQDGDRFRRNVPISDLDATGMPATAVSRTLSVPTGVQVRAEMNVHLDNESTAGRVCLLMTSLDEADTAPSYTVFTLIAGDNSAGRKPVCSYESIKTNTSAQIRTRFDFATTGTDRLKIVTVGWTDTRGRDE